MPIIVGAKFKDSCKSYYFDPGEDKYELGEIVIVDTVRGNEMAVISQVNTEVQDDEIKGELKKVLRKASDKDLSLAAKASEMEKTVVQTAHDKAVQLGVDMKFISAEVAFDCKRVVLYFTADGRVDFRDLVKELASVLHARIELRQLYERDDVKLRGALGMCGRECCCRAYLKDFEKVTVKMAKMQGLSLNPTKISGICGKLMCCLKYENEYYSEVFKQMPKVNSKVMTPEGPAVVESNDMLKKIVTCKVFTDDTYVIKKFPLDQIVTNKKQNVPEPEIDDADDDNDSLE